MPFKQLSLPVALVAFVVLLESPLALASKNITRWRNFAQDPSSSDFTVSFCSGLVPLHLYDADDGLGVRRLGSTQRYENILRPRIRTLTKTLSQRRQVPAMFQLPFTQIQVWSIRRVRPLRWTVQVPSGMGRNRLLGAPYAISYHRVVWYPD